MRLRGQERAEVLELIEEYLAGMDDNGLVNVLEMARSSWRAAQRREAAGAAAEAVAEAAAEAGKIIPFPRR